MQQEKPYGRKPVRMQNDIEQKFNPKKNKDMTLNREFKFVFNPKEPEQFNGRRYFGIGANSLYKYIGAANAETVIRKALASKDDKIKIKFRKHGAIYVYVQ